MQKHLLAFSLIPFAVACGGTIDPQTPNTPPTDPTTPDTEPSLVTTEASGMHFFSKVDSTNSEAWVFVSFQSGGVEVSVEDPMTSKEWDLGFRRSNVRLNGGASGNADGAVAAVFDQSFDDLERAPGRGWATDEPGEEAPAGVPVRTDGVDFAFTRTVGEARNGWFSYNPATHVLTPVDMVWVVRGPDEKYFAVQIIDWYDEAGTSAVWSIQWKPVLAPEGGAMIGFKVDASSSEDTVYVNLSSEGVVSAGPAGTDWDLAMSRTNIQTNSGISGTGLGGARMAPDGISYAQATSSPTSGFTVDTDLPIPGPPGSGTAPGNPALAQWFDYDSSTQTVSPKQTWFLVRSAEGNYFKLRVLAWEDGVYTLETAPVTRAPDIVELEVDATSEDTTTFVSLRLGTTIESSFEDATWDLALTRTVLQTNSGVSGSGQGGATVAEAATLEELDAGPASFDEDSMIPSSRPGGMDYAGNPALSAWFDYDPVTHVVSPKDEVYALRTADGGLAAFVIDGYEDGLYQLRLLYAGAGQERFQ